MSGTSLDGIDAVRVQLHPRRAWLRRQNAGLHGRCRSIRALRARDPGGVSAGTARCAGAALQALQRTDTGAGVHRGGVGGEGCARRRLHRIARADAGARRRRAARRCRSAMRFGIRGGEPDGTVLYDFRSADTAAGGSGAPLVPYVDALLLADAAETSASHSTSAGSRTSPCCRRTPRRPTSSRSTAAPAICTIDTYVELGARGGNVRFDRAGAFALAGAPDETLVARVSDRPVLRAGRPPKTTGRERFGAPFVAQHRGGTRARCRLPMGVRHADRADDSTPSRQRSATAARGAVARTIVSGGGAHNLALLRRLARPAARQRRDIGRATASIRGMPRRRSRSRCWATKRCAGALRTCRERPVRRARCRSVRSRRTI